MIHSFGVLTTLSAQRIVVASTSNAFKVQYPDTVTSLPIGITKDTVLDTTSGIEVAGVGEIAKLYFNDTVTSGGLVGSDSSGRGIPFALAATSTSISAPAAYLGVLLGPTIGLTGTIAEVLIQPGFDRKSA